MEADQEIIRSGKGTSYVISFTDEYGKPKSMQLIKEPIFDDDGNATGIIAIGNDVTENEMLKQELQIRALTDAMTGLGNHRAFEEYVEKACQSAELPLSVISADCDNLKKVNDTFGHQIGDDYITLAASVLKETVPEGCTLFRTGGDEFIVFLPGMPERRAQEIVEAMRGRAGDFAWIDSNVGMSYGLAVAESLEDVPAAVIEADRRMYADKIARKRGRDF